LSNVVKMSKVDNLQKKQYLFTNQNINTTLDMIQKYDNLRYIHSRDNQ
jgi:hypothetical protein